MTTENMATDAEHKLMLHSSITREIAATLQHYITAECHQVWVVIHIGHDNCLKTALFASFLISSVGKSASENLLS